MATHEDILMEEFHKMVADGWTPVRKRNVLTGTTREQVLDLIDDAVHQLAERLEQVTSKLAARPRPSSGGETPPPARHVASGKFIPGLFHDCTPPQPDAWKVLFPDSE